MNRFFMIILVFLSFFSNGGEPEQLPFDPDFLENAVRFDIKESMLKRTMTFIGADETMTRCKYGFPMISARANNFRSDNPSKAKASSKIVNAFSSETFAVKAISHSQDVETDFGKSRTNDTSIEILDAETGTKHGFFELKISMETILEGSFKREPVSLHEVVTHEDGRLPLFETNRYPTPTTGFFELKMGGETGAYLVVYQRPRRKIACTLFVDQRLSPEKQHDAVSLFLLFPILRTIGLATLR